ncbi:ornithine cyclodeaminase family protein [Streptomyces sp. B8F3]|uniref:ornithine cyclodeaminase family protein n=1 Tax=Streptomyces sp. B8F3 TaxID=3153573 RepID=UPI00325D3B4E
MKTRVLDAYDMAEIFRAVGRDAIMDRVINELTAALSASATGDRHQTFARSGFIRTARGPGVLEWMPHYERGRSATVKMVAYTPTNPVEHAMPTVLGTVTRYEDATGRLTACADAVVLTAVRTGAASAVASRLLASRSSRAVGLIGAGAQAVTQLHALSRVFDVAQVLVHDVNEDNARSFLARTAWLGLNMRVTTAQEAAEGSDILCTATTTGIGQPPLFHDKNIPNHLHINGIGSDLPGKTELPLDLLRRAFVCPDFPEQARREGECQQLSHDEIGPALATLCKHPEIAESVREELTVFDSTGTPLEDHITLDIFLEFAAERGIGNEIQIEYHPDDVLNPYPFLS